MYEDTAVRYMYMTTMYMWLTNIGSFWIISMYIGHFAGIVHIIKDLWNMKSILVTTLFWVTWNPTVSSWRVSFCFTYKSYTLFYTHKIFSFNFNNLGWICRSILKVKIRLWNSIYTNIHRINLHQKGTSTSNTSIQVNDSTHYNTKEKWKVPICVAP